MTPAIAAASTVIWVFLGATILFHIGFVYLWPLSDRGWKQVDYIWLSVTVVSLVAVADEAKHWFADLKVAAEEDALKRTDRELLVALGHATMHTCGRSFTRSAFSPANFDEVVQEYKAICEWLKVQSGSIRAELLKPLPDQKVLLLIVA